MGETFSLEDLAMKARSSFFSWSKNLIMANLIAWQPWLGTPVVKWFVEALVSLVLKILIDKGELGAFMMNTKILTSSQAREYRDAVAGLMSLPPHVAAVEWEMAERKANEAFDKLVRFSS